MKKFDPGNDRSSRHLWLSSSNTWASDSLRLSRPLRAWLGALLLGATLGLVACGGGSGGAATTTSTSTSTPTPTASGKQAPTPDAKRFATQIGSVATNDQTRRAFTVQSPGGLEPDQWFNWAERSYPQLFPPGAQTQPLVHEGVSYAVRHYPDTGNYLGVAGGRAYALGDFTAQRVRDYGHLDYYICLENPARCPAEPNRSRVWTFAGTLSCGSVPIQQPLQALRQRLVEVGAEVTAAVCGHSLLYASCQACGCQDTRILVYDLPIAQSPLAFGLGLQPYQEGKEGATQSPSVACDY